MGFWARLFGNGTNKGGPLKAAADLGCQRTQQVRRPVGSGALAYLIILKTPPQPANGQSYISKVLKSPRASNIMNLAERDGRSRYIQL
jgi:hypothetical protein